MHINDYIKLAPHTLTISPTHKCTAECRECCFGCSPNIKHILEYDKIVKYIDEAVRDFPCIKILVLTGGECFLLGQTLDEIIRYASSKNLLTRVVTNGFWADSYELACIRLQTLVEAGLTEINFSTGDNHQKYVKFDNIVNAVRAANDLGIKSICISLEAPLNAKFTSQQLKDNILLEPLLRNGNVMFIEAAWMFFKKQDEQLIEKNKKIYFRSTKRPCHNIFQGITINPYSQQLACCGLTVEYNKYLKLGSLDCHSIKELYHSQFNDLFKFWLYVDGPEYIYEMVMQAKKTPKLNLPHECAYCMELVREEENIKVIQELVKKELPNIIYHYKMRTTTFNI